MPLEQEITLHVVKSATRWEIVLDVGRLSPETGKLSPGVSLLRLDVCLLRLEVKSSLDTREHFRVWIRKISASGELRGSTRFLKGVGTHPRQRSR
jgi:hypothetical protein